MKPKGAKHNRTRGMWQVPPFAAKLTRRHREAARADETFEQALRKQTMYPQRIDALIAGQTWYGGKPCVKCDSVKRRVYDNSCWTCHTLRTGFALDARNRCVSLGLRKQSRDGYLDRLERKRREAAGEVWAFVIGDWRARVYPTGRLAVNCDRLGVHSEDWRNAHPTRIFEIGSKEPDLVEVMRLAGWSV
ncbi:MULTISPECIES: hypothetical protein [Burkholderia]|uniref:hypothetical protein n=1 Tax=Burkholderia TaxID=32008 RepID=UPI000759C9FD|nr:MULTISPECIES: hypothetical protein [Burkholderia]AOJ68305.1 hypothetical protein WS78_05710 [Burkholderia savannae]KVG41876.1 hypothetical protein WS77_15750 [Burkholderia sp. MSMB0265]KVG86461.1 hypothetical protein WS81_03315 [Burkholderia sp. MSMB2040]KVG98677.1 hypothetical protein WS82_26440 [Burkholderia sp. MSMB2041]KVG99472.1 hypothetical protein WS83_25775 [Burkholderia sp. MSMB2042]